MRQQAPLQERKPYVIKAFCIVAAFVMLAHIPALAADAPSPDALRAWHMRELRVAGIMHKLRLANLASCPKQEMTYGLAVARLDNRASPAVRTAQAQALGLQDYPTALGVLPGSAAEQAGLREGDRIEAVGGISWPMTDGVPGARKAFWDAFYAGIQAPTLEIKAERGGQMRDFRLIGNAGCTASLFMINRNSVDASTFGLRIQVNSGLEALLQDDAELAFVLAHELAHVILEHTGPGKEAQVKDRVVRQRIEIEADHLAVLLMARAGFASAAAAASIPRMRKTNGPISRLLGIYGPYMSTDERVAFLTKRADEVRAQLAAEVQGR
jgi:hypothetical protein